MSQLERNFEIDLKPNGAVVVNESTVDLAVGIPPVAGGSIEADLDLSTKGKIKRYKALQDTIEVVKNADVLASSHGDGRAFRGVIKK